MKILRIMIVFFFLLFFIYLSVVEFYLHLVEVLITLLRFYKFL